MRLTKKKALEIALELWEWIVDNPGKEKIDWSGWKKYGKMSDDCPFCEYEERHRSAECEGCPLERKYEGCGGSAFGTWIKAMCNGKKEAAHKAAVEFLAQLKELR